MLVLCRPTAPLPSTPSTDLPTQQSFHLCNSISLSLHHNQAMSSKLRRRVPGSPSPSGAGCASPQQRYTANAPACSGSCPSVSSAPTISAVDSAIVRPEPSWPAATTSPLQPCTAEMYGRPLRLAGLGPQRYVIRSRDAFKYAASLGMYVHASATIASATATSSTALLDSPLCLELPAHPPAFKSGTHRCMLRQLQALEWQLLRREGRAHRRHCAQTLFRTYFTPVAC